MWGIFEFAIELRNELTNDTNWIQDWIIKRINYRINDGINQRINYRINDGISERINYRNNDGINERINDIIIK